MDSPHTIWSLLSKDSFSSAALKVSSIPWCSTCLGMCYSHTLASLCEREIFRDNCNKTSSGWELLCNSHRMVSVEGVSLHKGEADIAAIFAPTHTHTLCKLNGLSVYTIITMTNNFYTWNQRLGKSWRKTESGLTLETLLFHLLLTILSVRSSAPFHVWCSELPEPLFKKAQSGGSPPQIPSWP